MKHTKLPWELLTLDGKIPAIRTILSSVGEADRFSATIKIAGTEPPFEIICVLDFGYGTPDDEANAKFIIRACNNHHELLEALKAMRDWIGPNRRQLTRRQVVEIMEYAIAKAGEDQSEN